ncbi:MAG: GDSL-type esterase/lipase family protein [Candidatus Symbiothrix sp.]|jgi:lysophospholipase L1-like esterase|nr:GDSL-type esterase/lipase family protein [Candidatus Symbiothrix sp.]
MKPSKTLLFLAGVLVSLGIISAIFPKQGLALWELQLYFPTLEDVFAPQEGQSTAVTEQMDAMELSLKMQQDSLAEAAYNDSLKFYLDFFANHPSRMHLPNDNWSYFDALFDAFDHCQEQQKVVRVLHYGDSQIEGDRITGYLRQRLQEKFGGIGPGLLPAVQVVPSTSVGQTASDNIARYIISGNFANRAGHRRFGVLGQLGVATSNESRITIKARDWKQSFENGKKFQKIRLFVGHTSPYFRADLTIPKKGSFKETISDPNLPVSVLQWNLPDSISKFTLNLYGRGEIYGIAADGRSGIAVDNIPFRGSSGDFFTKMDSTVLASMFNELNARLILLEFGGNMTPSIKNNKAVEAYQQTMSKQIALLKTLCPQAKIILIGPADMSTKIHGALQTYPYLEKTIAALREAALSNGVAFWNMYDVMGGHNSMIKWVKNSPSLAATDYIHFNAKGAERIAELFYESLDIYYDYHHFVNDKH